AGLDGSVHAGDVEAPGPVLRRGEVGGRNRRLGRRRRRRGDLHSLGRRAQGRGGAERGPKRCGGASKQDVSANGGHRRLSDARNTGGRFNPALRAKKRGILILRNLPFPQGGRGGPLAAKRVVERESLRRRACRLPYPPSALPPARGRGRPMVPLSQDWERKRYPSGSSRS